jgi:hypothetical protein
LSRRNETVCILIFDYIPEGIESVFHCFIILLSQVILKAKKKYDIFDGIAKYDELVRSMMIICEGKVMPYEEGKFNA